MGRFFASFEEAWQYFLDRDEPLESFFADLPETESYVLAWVLGFDSALVPRVRATQGAFSALTWITPQPAHFLHTSIATVSVSSRSPTDAEIGIAVDRARDAWSGMRSFEVEHRRVNCFHSAVVVEVAGPGPQMLVSRLFDAGFEVDPERFLPHVTIGLINEPTGASQLRDALVRIRETRIGAQTIADAQLCVVPASRATILTPWDVVGRVRFDV